MVFGEGGLIKRAEQSRETHLEAQAREKLNLKIGEYKVDINKQNIKDAALRESYLSTTLGEIGTTKEATDTKYYEVIVDGYVFWVKKDTQEIVSKGKDNTPATIEVESISLNKQTLKVGIGKTSEALNVTFTPANATNKTIIWKAEPTSVATVSDGKVTGIAEGIATITATSANGKTATCSVTVEEIGMTIAEAKAAVTSYATLQQYIGTKITDYNPTAGGKWRIFYYDADGEFGTAGKLYLKRDYDSNLYTILSNYTSYTPSAESLAIMKAMNPKWRDSSYSSIDLVNEHCVAWLCDPANWTKYKTAEADYAIGSPSVEMYMKAFNVWKTGNKDATNLICKVEREEGYSVGANGTYENGYSTNKNTIEAGPNNIFTAGSNYWWLASPSSYGSNYVLRVYGGSAYVTNSNYSTWSGLCPVVSL